MRFDIYEYIAKTKEIYPDFSWEEDNQGQLIVYTGMMLDEWKSSLIPFSPEED